MILLERRAFTGRDLGTGDEVRKSLAFCADCYVPARPLTRAYADGALEAIRRFGAGVPPDVEDALDHVTETDTTIPVRDPSPVWGLEHLDGVVDFAHFDDDAVHGLSRVSLLLDEAAFEPARWTPEKRTRLLNFLESFTVTLLPRVAYAHFDEGPQPPPAEDTVDRIAWASVLPGSWTEGRHLPFGPERRFQGYGLYALGDHPAHHDPAREAAWATAWPSG